MQNQCSQPLPPNVTRRWTHCAERRCWACCHQPAKRLSRLPLRAHSELSTHPGWANRATDILLAWAFEFKAFTLFSFLFGVGAGVQAERAAMHQRSAARFLARRFAVLLGIGLCHMLLLWNGDILTLYAVCGLLLIPFVAMSGRWLAALGLAILVLSPFIPFFDGLFPTETAMRAQADIATRVYATGSFTEIMALRFNEAAAFYRAAAHQFSPAHLWLDAAGRRFLAKRRPATTGRASQVAASHSRRRRQSGRADDNVAGLVERDRPAAARCARLALSPFSCVASLRLRRRSAAVVVFCACSAKLDG